MVMMERIAMTKGHAELVSSLSQVAENIQTYSRAIKRSPELAARMSRHSAWYALRDAKGQWLFGPSKFIGYLGIDAESYLGRYERRHGSRTEGVLEQWFVEVEPDSRLGRELYSQLELFTSHFGKRPKKDFRISVAADEIGSEVPAKTSDRRSDERIVSDAGICGGRPRIRGTRIRVSDIVEMIAEGVSREEIIADFPYVQDEDITAALRYAARAAHHPVLHAA